MLSNYLAPHFSTQRTCHLLSDWILSRNEDDCDITSNSILLMQIDMSQCLFYQQKREREREREREGYVWHFGWRGGEIDLNRNTVRY